MSHYEILGIRTATEKFWENTVQPITMDFTNFSSIEVVLFCIFCNGMLISPQPCQEFTGKLRFFC